jgi:hypothetical protein
VFLSLLKVLVVSVSARVIERSLLALDRTCTFCCIVYVSTLNNSALVRDIKPTLERSELIRLIAPQWRLSALANCYIHACLQSIAPYLHSSTSP